MKRLPIHVRSGLHSLFDGPVELETSYPRPLTVYSKHAHGPPLPVVFTRTNVPGVLPMYAFISRSSASWNTKARTMIPAPNKIPEA